MYKIGEFSKLCKLSVKTLRYYADIGLLKPEYIDEFSGYRYYAANQLAIVARIQALKDMGVSLEEIRENDDDMISLLERRENEIRKQIRSLNEQLKQLEASIKLLQREDIPMFHVNMKEQESMRVHSIRQIFASREDALEKMKLEQQKNGCGQAIIINYENAYAVNDLDLELAFPAEKGEKELFAGIPIPGYEKTGHLLMASLICRAEELDDAYRYLIQCLNENLDYQIVGDAYEWYRGEGMIELQLPVHKLHAWENTPECDDIQIPFVPDEDVVGRWRTVACCQTKDGFNPSHYHWSPQDGDIREIYFLPEGERYWCFGWTKGFLLSRFGVEPVEGLNPYEIVIRDGKPYLFVWFKDNNCFYRGALPSLIVLEKVDSRHYTKDEIRIRDDMTTGFTEDRTVLGKWKVCDFVRNPDEFRHGEYNCCFPKEKLFFKWACFGKDGACEVQYGNEVLRAPIVDWSMGVIREWQSKLMQRYERRIIGETEYLFIQFKSGDYYYNHQEPWWYVFTRAVENM